MTNLFCKIQRDRFWMKYFILIGSKTWNDSHENMNGTGLFLLDECHMCFRFHPWQYRGQWLLFSLLMLSYLCLFQEAIQLDGEILFALLRRVSPLAFRHLEKHKIDPILYMTEWFMCAFSRTLPWASVLRVWDMFLCDGNALLLQWCQML